MGKKILLGGGGHFFHLECILSPFWGALFHLLGVIFSRGGGGAFFSTSVDKFLGFFPLTKFSAGTHGLAAIVVANTSSWGFLRYIVRRNLLIHFGAHFHIMLRKTKK